ncbi:MAG: molybdopterin-dependent oxidoreductase [Planctomycetes bacterium]|nr:molybdopterin-dependent oxidoreductase [Planctomycetota bacterium]
MAGHETTRRDVLKAVGAAGIGATFLAGCHKHDPYDLRKPAVPGADSWAKGEERHIATACGQCEAGCGVQMRIVEGRAVKVEGNAACPINRGGVGPRGLSAPQVLYDPDRIVEPMRRVNGRDRDEWEAISWEDAIELVTERLEGLRENEQPHKLGIMNGRERGFVPEIWSRFATAFGTPNLFTPKRSEHGAQLAAMEYMQGVSELPVYDWSNAAFVLSLSSGVLDTSCQLLHFVRALGEKGRKAERARVFHVDSVHSRAAMVADESLQTAPGTHGALALGLAHILVRDGKYDAEFVEQHTSGFEDWEDAAGTSHMGFKTLLDRYTPEKVADICQVPVEKIERIARLLVTHRPSFALVGQEELRSSNGVKTAMAVHALNALLGAIDREGGVLVPNPVPLEDWPEVVTDDIADEGLEQTGLLEDVERLPWDVLPERILGAGESSLDTLFLTYANPVYSRPESDHWREALASIPFIVSFSPTLDETTSEFADLILPDCTWLERWEDSGALPSIGRAAFTFRQPVVDPLYNTRETADVVIALAQALGEEVGSAMPWKDMKSAFKKRIIGIYKAKSGSIVESKGATFLKRFFDEGYWAGDEYQYGDWDRVLKTKSGRFEFFSNKLWSQLERKAQAEGKSLAQLSGDWVGQTEPDLLCLPSYQPVAEAGDRSKFNLLLRPYRGGNYTANAGVSLPWLAELAPWTGRPIWRTEVEIHPTVADRYSIAQGDTVRVRSEVGELVGMARITAGVREEIVRIPQGGGRTAGGRFAEGWGANVMGLVSMKTMDPWGGSSPLLGTRVSIEKVNS